MRIQPSSDDEDFGGSQAEEDDADDEEDGLPLENHFYLAAAGVKDGTRKPSSVCTYLSGALGLSLLTVMPFRWPSLSRQPRCMYVPFLKHLENLSH